MEQNLVENADPRGQLLTYADVELFPRAGSERRFGCCSLRQRKSAIVSVGPRFLRSFARLNLGIEA